MTERGRIDVGEQRIEYRVLRSVRRKKTVAIRLEPNGEVIVSSPQRLPAAQIVAIVRHRASWILRRAAEIEQQPPAVDFAGGQMLPYLGQQIRLLIEQSMHRRARLGLDGVTLRIEAPASWAILTSAERHDAIQRLLERWYRERALSDVRERVAQWAPHVCGSPKAVLVRDQRWRWGSCSADGTLRFNWRLIMAEPELIDYVVVHELAHLRVSNHSADYWAEVAKLMPDYKQRRARLKDVGPSLTLERKRACTPVSLSPTSNRARFRISPPRRRLLAAGGSMRLWDSGEMGQCSTAQTEVSAPSVAGRCFGMVVGRSLSSNHPREIESA